MSEVAPNPGPLPAPAINPPAHHKGFHLGYHPSLDGIRAVAVLFVLLGHGKVLGDGFASMAVNVFFVLSGFLITSLLIAEWDKSNGISLKDFYFRRALRLLPALMVMLLVFVAYVFIMDPRKRAIRELYEALRALFYCTNWAKIWRFGRTDFMTHTWSLSVEEQFYFLWPAILLLLLRRTNRTSMLCWIFLGAFISFLVRLALSIGGTQAVGDNVLEVGLERLAWGLDTRADALLSGAFAGVLVSSRLLPTNRRFTRALTFGAPVCVIGLLILCTFSIYDLRVVCAGFLLNSLGTAILITHLISSRSFLHLLLENRVLVWIGRISYGLYLWHYPILRAFQTRNLPWQNLAYLAPVFLVAAASFYLLERPCLRLKERFKNAD